MALCSLRTAGRLISIAYMGPERPELFAHPGRRRRLTDPGPATGTPKAGRRGGPRRAACTRQQKTPREREREGLRGATRYQEP